MFMSNSKSKNNNGLRGRHFNLLLYPDNPQHMLAILELQTKKYLACGCCHKYDVFEEDTETHKQGELKKEHYHFVVSFKNARYKSALAKELDIDERWIDKTENFKHSAKYLLHWGSDTKYVYSPDDLVGKLKPEVLKLLEIKYSESQQATFILDYIDSYNGYISKSQLSRWAIENGYFSCLRRCYSMVLDWIYEHNEKYCKSAYKE